MGIVILRQGEPGQCAVPLRLGLCFGITWHFAAIVVMPECSGLPVLPET